MIVNKEHKHQSPLLERFCQSTITVSKGRSWHKKLFDWTRVITPDSNKDLFTKKSWGHLQSAEKWKIFKNWIRLSSVVAGIALSIFSATACGSFVAKHLPFLSLNQDEQAFMIGLSLMAVIPILPLVIYIALEVAVVGVSVLMPGAAIAGLGCLAAYAIDCNQVKKHHRAVLEDVKLQLNDAFKTLNLDDPIHRHRVIKNLYHLRQVLYNYRIDKGLVRKALIPFNQLTFTKERIEDYQFFSNNVLTFQGITKGRENQLSMLINQYKQAGRIPLSDVAKKEIADKIRDTELLLSKVKKNRIRYNQLVNKQRRYHSPPISFKESEAIDKEFSSHFYQALAQNKRAAIDYIKANPWDRIGFIEMVANDESLSEEVKREKDQLNMWRHMK